MAYSGYDGNAYRPQGWQQPEGSLTSNIRVVRLAAFMAEHAAGQFAVLGNYFERHTRAMWFGDAVMTYGALAFA